jgi:hypothetical protein
VLRCDVIYSRGDLLECDVFELASQAGGSIPRDSPTQSLMPCTVTSDPPKEYHVFWKGSTNPIIQTHIPNHIGPNHVGKNFDHDWASVQHATRWCSHAGDAKQRGSRYLYHQ